MTSKHNFGISRRNLLKGMGATALGAGLLSYQPDISYAKPAQQDEMASFTPLYQFMLGDFQLTVIGDASLLLPPASFGINAPDGAADAVIENNNYSPEARASVNCTLVNTGDNLVLLDTGVGTSNPDLQGGLVAGLAQIGISPEDIDTVILSHFHFDHVGGASMDGEVTFPNAQYYLSQIEWDFLQGDPTGDADADAAIAGSNALLQPVVDADQLAFYGDEEELVAGIQTVASLGHTPGHHSFLLASGGSQLMVTADVANNFLISLAHPDWHFSFDGLPDLAAETRFAFYGRVADEQLPVVAYHFPFPGVGYIARAGYGFRYLPAMI